MLVAPVTFQVKVVDCPGATVEGVAVKDTMFGAVVGAGVGAGDGVGVGIGVGVGVGVIDALTQTMMREVTLPRLLVAVKV
jgi:hypothetical protein